MFEVSCDRSVLQSRRPRVEGKDMTGTGNTAEMISPRTARARKKRADLMDAAARLIAEKGYHETSMRDIAAELGMSAASLYHYFPGKEDLVVALQRECFEKLMCDAEAVLQPLADPVERIHASSPTTCDSSSSAFRSSACWSMKTVV